MIAQKRQCFLHHEQRAANIDIECGDETFGRDCSERFHEIADTRTREDDVDVSLLRFSVSCSLICEAERRAPAIGARDHEADVLL